ncbi:MAG: AMP-binding protein [Streptosporangiaceae bacterium]
MTVTDMPAPHATVTQRLVGLSGTRGEHPALVGGSATWPGRTLSHAELAVILQTASVGLAWRGLRTQDVVGVYVPDAVSYVLAVHAIRAAGGVPSPISAASTVAAMAGQLRDCGARLLVTADPLVPAALSAADGSWVRQVIAFDEVPGTVPFWSLLSRGLCPPAWAGPADLGLVPYTARPDGRIGADPVTHAQLASELSRVSAPAPVTHSDVVLAAPPEGCVREYTVLLDLALLQGATVVATPADALPDAALRYGGTAAIVPAGMAFPAGLPVRPVTVAC